MSSLEQLVAANTRFGFKLFAEVARQDAGKNVFISPSSVAMALAMTYNGASGETQRAMAEALELQGMSLDQVNRASAELRETLESLDPQVRLAVANSLWLKHGETFRSEFVQRTRSFYDAEVANFGNNDALIALGMGVAFTRAADFSEMTPPPAFIGLVKHKAFIEVNEEGTEAAAATVVMVIGGISLSAPFTMIVDHPFFYAIRDNETGTILFMGSIVDPQ